MNNNQTRIISIDIFRGITMLLMIFVNDFWTLSGIPLWLEHAKADQDFLGFSDIIFPCFLFIVGMSIPYAIRNRLKKGENQLKILKHIILRSLALLVMGYFTVNIGHLNVIASGISREVFEIIMTIAFFLIWNIYPKTETWKKYLYVGLQVFGILILIALYLVFRGGKDGTGSMSHSWWGILGLIGWTYLITSTIYLFANKSQLLLIFTWVLFTMLNIADQAHWFRTIIPGGGAFEGFAFAGILATLVNDRAGSSDQKRKLPFIYLSAGILMIIAGFGLRNFFIISKIHATPTWVFLCNGIALGVFGFVYLVADLYGKAKWFNFLKPAGSSTLTCYLIPYIYYSLATFAFTLPTFIKTGIPGLFKSFVYALIIIGITEFLGRIKIKLKI